MSDLSWADGIVIHEGNTTGPQGLLPPTEHYKVQGTEAWKQWRGKGLGSSDSAVLLGWSPYKTLDELYREKIGEFKPEFGFHQQKAMQRGKDLEPVIRRWFEKERNDIFTEDAEESRKHAFMRASYDGINRNYKNADGSVGALIEIKAPNKADHELAKNGMLPDKYMSQCQWLMMVAELSWCYYVSFGTDGTYAVVDVKADPAIQNELERRALIVWQCIADRVPPPDFPRFEPGQLGLNLEHPSIPSQEIEAVCAEALKLKAEIETLEGKFEVCKTKLKAALGNETKMVAGEAVFGIQERKGQVDYSKVVELQGVDLDPYRKAPTYAFYFKRVAEK